MRRRFGREIHCHHNLVNSKATQDATIPQAIQGLDQNSRRTLMGR